MLPQLRSTLTLRGDRLTVRVLYIFFSELDWTEKQEKTSKSVNDYVRLLAELIAKKWIKDCSKKSYVDKDGRNHVANKDNSPLRCK